MYQKIETLCIEKGITIGKLCRETGISSSTFTELKSGRTKELSAKNASKVADYFNVSLDYLMGKSQNKKSPTTDSDEALKFALWGGDSEIIDEDMIEDVKDFARLLAEKKKRKMEQNK